MLDYTVEANKLAMKMTAHAAKLPNTESGRLLSGGAEKITALIEQLRTLQEENKALQIAIEQAETKPKVRHVFYDYDSELKAFVQSGQPTKIVFVQLEKGRHKGVPSAQGFRSAVERGKYPVEVYQKQLTEKKMAIHLTRTDI